MLVSIHPAHTPRANMGTIARPLLYSTVLDSEYFMALLIILPYVIWKHSNAK